jgi:hypothetical protein
MSKIINVRTKLTETISLTVPVTVTADEEVREVTAQEAEMLGQVALQLRLLVQRIRNAAESQEPTSGQEIDLKATDAAIKAAMKASDHSGPAEMTDA